MKIINSHTHIIKKPTKKVPQGGDINELKKDMEKGTISHCLLFSSFGDGEEIDYSLPELVEIIKKDTRFSIIYSVNVNGDLKKQKKEIEDYMKQGFVKGIKILLGYFHIMPDDKKLFPLYDLCEKYDLPVIFHTGDTLGADAKLKYSHPLNVDSLAVDKPNLKIVVAHLGNPWLTDTAEIIYKNPNVYGDLSGFFLDLKSKTYVRLMRTRINELLAYAGGDKLLFGTDFPLLDSANYIKFVKSLNLNKEEQENTFHKNAERLFKIN